MEYYLLQTMVQWHTQAMPPISQWPHTAVMQGLSWLVIRQEYVLLRGHGLDHNLTVQVVCIKVSVIFNKTVLYILSVQSVNAELWRLRFIARLRLRFIAS